MAKEAAELARDLDDRRTEARSLFVVGLVATDGDPHLPDLEASIAIAREVSDRWCLAHALARAGVGYFFTR